MRGFIKRNIIWVNIFIISCTFLSYLSPYVNPKDFWPVAFLGLTYPYLLFLNLFFIAFWLFLGKKQFLLSVITIIIGYHSLFSFIQINIKNENVPQEKLKVMSYNVRLFDLYNWGNNWSYNKENRDNIFYLLGKENPDIVCFQEYFYDDSKKFATTDTLPNVLNAKFYHINLNKHNRHHHFGIATYSKHPIINKGQLRFKNTGNLCIYSDIVVKKDTIRIYNCHLESIRFQYEDYNFIDSLNHNPAGTKLKGAKSIIGKLRAGFEKRSNQAHIIANHVKKSPFPVILTGDFNDTPYSYSYHTIAKELNDAFKQSGSGIGTSYASNIPFLRIDYIMTSDDFKTSNFKVIREKYSDHYPIKSYVWKK